jgi:iron-sulfur cluster repair protein YtfE (RIC family)
MLNCDACLVLVVVNLHVTSQYEEPEGAGISLDMTVFNVKAKNLQMHYILLRNRILFANFQSSTMVEVRSLFLCDATQCQRTTTG